MANLLTLFVCMVLSAPNYAQDSLTLGTIDFYGLRSITAEDVRAVLPYSPGDSIDTNAPFPATGLGSEMAEALQVSRVQLSAICCDKANSIVLYVGVEESSAIGMQYGPEPTGDVELPLEIQETDRQIESAMIAAIRAGDAQEDRSMGHSLMMNPEARALQERYVAYAEKYRDILIEVLHGSAQQRALAATVLAYSSDKKSIVPHLETAVLDPNAEVRNNAARALALIAQYANEHTELGIEIDAALELLRTQSSE